MKETLRSPLAPAMVFNVDVSGVKGKKEKNIGWIVNE
nr:MAG TPA: hypothetical protein [Caudoviricetes sp.]